MLHVGEAEDLKAGVHALLGALAALCCAYNSAAFAVRREPHLLANAGVYGALMVLEVQHVRTHRTAARQRVDAGD